MYLFFRSMWESIASKYQCQSASDYSLILYSICALLCSFFHSLSAFDFCSFLSDTVSFSPFNEKNEMKATTTTKTNGIIFNVIFSFRQQFTCLHQQKFNEENETQTHKKENGIKIETIQSGLYVGWNGYYVGLYIRKKFTSHHLHVEQTSFFSLLFRQLHRKTKLTHWHLEKCYSWNGNKTQTEKECGIIHIKSCIERDCHGYITITIRGKNKVSFGCLFTLIFIFLFSVCLLRCCIATKFVIH